MARYARGGAFAAAPAAAPAAATGVSADDILGMSPLWWLDADAEYVEEGSGDPVETDGDNVTNWIDRSGNDRHFVGYSSGYYPHWYSSGTNSKPYVWFEGDRLRWVGDATYSTPMTMYWVMSHDTATQSGLQFWNSASSYYRTYSTGSYPGGHRVAFGTSGEPIYNNVQSTDTRIIQLFASGSDKKLRVNGGADEGVDLLDASAQTENLITSGQNFYFGFGLQFKCYEWIVIPDVTHDQDKVFEYLADKYDLSVEDVS